MPVSTAPGTGAPDWLPVIGVAAGLSIAEPAPAMPAVGGAPGLAGPGAALGELGVIEDGALGPVGCGRPSSEQPDIIHAQVTAAQRTFHLAIRLPSALALAGIKHIA
jgi:hypothetical protein